MKEQKSMSRKDKAGENHMKKFDFNGPKYRHFKTNVGLNLF